ncbi:HAMP domain-containing protein [Bradyrhizobium diazoefficiens]|nr:HAMP domain-containing protein [Bradyrhizobium diazoefficiens]
MNFRIGTILPLIVSALVLLGVACSGHTAWRAYNERSEAQAFVETDQLSQLLLRSAGQWALERGLSNAALRSPEPASSEARAQIMKMRAGADQAFREAAGRLRGIGAMKDAQQRIAEAEDTFRGIEAFRGKVDENIAKGADQRDGEVIEKAQPTFTRLIELSSSRLRLTLETLTSPPSAELSRLVGIRHLGAQMAEAAGRERGFLGGTVTSRAKITADGIRRLADYRGQVTLAWATISPIVQRKDTPATIVAAVEGVTKDYFGAYDRIRDGVTAAGSAGDYAISGSDFMAGATTGINAILRLNEAIGSAAVAQATDQAAQSTSWLAIAAAVLLANVVLGLLSFWIALARIVRPLSALTRAMSELAAGNFAVVLPGLGRKDEVGDMAQAVEVFKVKAEQKARDEAEAKMRQDRIAAEQRRADMHRLAGEFEAAVGEIVDTVSSASTELEASAGTLNVAAGRAQQLAVDVSRGSEETSSNVQSVASATEQLSSSVDEIGRRVHDSAKMATDAVGQVERTNARIGELSRAAATIGDVIELIEQIAGQTNLLALNATIEAARAGEAGRGFAVVASEVKALAEQTAKATGEIGQQVTGIQAATQDSVTAIREIGSTISRLSEIASTIAAAVEEQGAATQEITRNVQQAARGTQQVSANVGDVQRGAAETGTASSQVLSAAQMLARDSSRLKLELGKFLVTVRAA